VLHCSRAAIPEKGGRRRREEGGLPGVEGAGVLIGGARCGCGGEAGCWLWSPLEKEENRGLRRRREARGWSCRSGWGESCYPGCLCKGKELLGKVVAAASVVAATTEVTVAKKKIFTEDREREVVQPPREMV